MTSTKTRKAAAAATVYEQLEALAGPIVTHYRDDLTKHDRAFIDANPGVPFLHASRDCGTHIAPLMPAGDYPAKGERIPYLFGTADREHILDGVLVVVRYFLKSDNSKLFLYCNGSTVKQVTPERALEIAELYTARVRHEWSAFRFG